MLMNKSLVYGLLNLRQVDNAIAERQKVANVYREALRGDGITFFEEMPEYATTTHTSLYSSMQISMAQLVMNSTSR